jgi:hypothetical protein
MREYVIGPHLPEEVRGVVQGHRRRDIVVEEHPLVVRAFAAA